MCYSTSIKNFSFNALQDKHIVKNYFDRNSSMELFKSHHDASSPTYVT